MAKWPGNPVANSRLDVLTAVFLTVWSPAEIATGKVIGCLIQKKPQPRGLRGALLAGTITSATAISVGVASKEGNARLAAASTQSTVPVEVKVNGQPYRFSVDPRTSLLDLLRDHAGLTGTKKGCDHGQCGACTVLTDGKRTLSCMSFAAMNDGRKITTIEGLSSADGPLHPMQHAFIDRDAFQCGYWTPGQILSAVACVHEGTCQ